MTFMVVSMVFESVRDFQDLPHHRPSHSRTHLPLVEAQAVVLVHLTWPRWCVALIVLMVVVMIVEGLVVVNFGLHSQVHQACRRVQSVISNPYGLSLMMISFVQELQECKSPQWRGFVWVTCLMMVVLIDMTFLVRWRCYQCGCWCESKLTSLQKKIMQERQLMYW